ncbi:MAG TPA: flagellar hook-length control protein FliK [Gammaproteobacteria bacterium]|nr:flagellar hook-length control protein FliK [Gammaproteobacteria bacterium]
MSEVLAVSAPPSPPSPQKVEKSAPEKSANDETGKTQEREFSDVLDEATEAPPADPAMLDPAAAIAAAPAATNVVDEAGAEGGELGLGGSAAMGGRLPLGAQPLRPEARAALGSTLPEASAAKDPARAPRGDEAAMQADEDAQGCDARAHPGKPFELAADKPGAPAAAERAVEAEAPATPPQPPSNAAEVAAEAHRRERPAALKLDTHLPVHTPRFAEGFNQQVVVLAQHGIQQAQLSLTPPDLGPVDVRITIAHDEASVQIAAPSGVAREAIQEALPKLKEMMEQSGLRLNDANVFAQLPQRDSPGAQQRAEWWQQQQQLNGGARGVADEALAPVVSRHLGLVDAYA